MDHANKRTFLLGQFVPLLQQIPSDTLPHWGKMTLQQMTEHFSDYVRLAAGKIVPKEMVTPPSQLPQMLAFLESEKPFRENTPNPLMPEVPAPVRNRSIAEAFAELQGALDQFDATFAANPHLTTLNPFFGDLNFQQNVQLLYKHATHHLRQFGVTIG
ncbi:DinB family protein [Flaviaesturariibacter amylovorans]|uniref:DinB-like domain-containing protein n=1 Tax=Flaviaesturariibacter amylovorans TaxID=1084520 RepID=A0ABP8HPP0_9BACT